MNSAEGAVWSRRSLRERRLQKTTARMRRARKASAPTRPPESMPARLLCDEESRAEVDGSGEVTDGIGVVGDTTAVEYAKPSGVVRLGYAGEVLLVLAAVKDAEGGPLNTDDEICIDDVSSLAVAFCSGAELEDVEFRNVEDVEVMFVLWLGPEETVEGLEELLSVRLAVAELEVEAADVEQPEVHAGGKESVLSLGDEHC